MADSNCSRCNGFRFRVSGVSNGLQPQFVEFAYEIDFLYGVLAVSCILIGAQAWDAVFTDLPPAKHLKLESMNL